MSQVKINATYLNMLTGGDQVLEVIEDWESARDDEKLEDWGNSFRPQLTDEDIAELTDLIWEIRDEGNYNSRAEIKQYEDGIIELVKPHVKGFKKWLREEMGLGDSWGQGDDWGLEQHQL